MSKQRKVVFLILPNIHFLDLSGADQVFLEALDYGAKFSIEYCSFTNNLVASTGLPIGKVQHFSAVEMNTGDLLFIPGANMSYLYSADFASQTPLFQWIRALHQQKITICSICTSAFVLAMCGLLDGKNCTTHWKRTAELQAKFPKAKVQENILFVEEKGLFTSAGVTSGIDMALHILAQLEGEYMAYKVARELVVYNRRTGIEVQQSLFMKYRNHIHVGIHNVQDWLQEQLKDYQSLSQLAEIACMSDRNLTRIFKKETGLTINEYITLLRKEKIEAMLKNPDYSRPQIAKACGLKSERHLSRLMELKLA